MVSDTTPLCCRGLGKVLFLVVFRGSGVCGGVAFLVVHITKSKIGVRESMVFVNCKSNEK